MAEARAGWPQGVGNYDPPLPPMTRAAVSAYYLTHQSTVMPANCELPRRNFPLPASGAIHTPLITNWPATDAAKRRCWILIGQAVHNPQAYSRNQKRYYHPYRDCGQKKKRHVAPLFLFQV